MLYHNPWGKPSFSPSWMKKLTILRSGCLHIRRQYAQADLAYEHVRFFGDDAQHISRSRKSSAKSQSYTRHFPLLYLAQHFASCNALAQLESDSIHHQGRKESCAVNERVRSSSHQIDSTTTHEGCFKVDREQHEWEKVNTMYRGAHAI